MSEASNHVVELAHGVQSWDDGCDAYRKDPAVLAGQCRGADLGCYIDTQFEHLPATEVGAHAGE